MPWRRASMPERRAAASDAAALRGPAAVVRDGGHVADREDLETGVRERADGALPAGARALHEHVDAAEAEVVGFLGRIAGGHRGGVGGVLPAAPEALLPGARPRDRVAVGVGE